MSNTSATKRSLELANFAHGVLLKAVGEFPENKAVSQPCPTDNHLLWHMGHLANNYNWFASAIDGRPTGVSESDNTLFGMGSKPVADPKAYPSVAQLRQRLDEGWKRLSAAAASLRDEDADKAPLVESGGFLTSRVDAIDKTAWHDGWHAGQIAGIRKALGLKGVFA